jgi:16S rRNA (adenine1518-N6/adenine1519-N6)-dimethyltransferase
LSGLDSLPPLRDVVSKHDLMAKKSLGQNFLFDLNLTGRIARSAGPLREATVIEVGPGPGGLTRALLAEGARKVIAIERDERCLAALAEIQSACPGRLEVIAADALETDFAAIARAHGGDGPTRIVANLPYNIGTVLLTNWIDTAHWPPFWDKMVLMFQREVAERIVATPDTRADYGRLGILCGWRTRARILFDVPPAAFTPPPKVTSSVVEITPREKPLPCNGETLARIAQAAFGQRRKMLRQSLKSLGVDVAQLLAQSGAPETARAEEIDVAGFVAMANAFDALRVKG